MIALFSQGTDRGLPGRQPQPDGAGVGLMGELSASRTAARFSAHPVVPVVIQENHA